MRWKLNKLATWIHNDGSSIEWSMLSEGSSFWMYNKIQIIKFFFIRCKVWVVEALNSIYCDDFSEKNWVINELLKFDYSLAEWVYS